jgi:hypothetical protein
MKIYFIASSAYYLSHKDEFHKIKERLNKLGEGEVYTVTDKKNEGDYEDPVKLVQSAEKLIQNSDVVIAEGSLASPGLGYDIAKAITLKKPVLVLSHEDLSKLGTPHALRLNSKLLSYKEYNDKNLEEVVRVFLKEAKNLLDTKFILIIPAEIDRYLEWASKEKRMHKAQLVREAIESLIDDDAEYQDYLKTL